VNQILSAIGLLVALVLGSVLVLALAVAVGFAIVTVTLGW
jgi:hypothetical protein